MYIIMTVGVITHIIMTGSHHYMLVQLEALPPVPAFLRPEGSLGREGCWTPLQRFECCCSPRVFLPATGGLSPAAASTAPRVPLLPPTPAIGVLHLLGRREGRSLRTGIEEPEKGSVCRPRNTTAPAQLWTPLLSLVTLWAANGRNPACWPPPTPPPRQEGSCQVRCCRSMDRSISQSYLYTTFPYKAAYRQIVITK